MAPIIGFTANTGTPEFNDNLRVQTWGLEICMNLDILQLTLNRILHGLNEAIPASAECQKHGKRVYGLGFNVTLLKLCQKKEGFQSALGFKGASPNGKFQVEITNATPRGSGTIAPEEGNVATVPATCKELK